MSVNINQICKSAYFALHRIGKIRGLLDQSSTEKLVHAFVSSRLDYCNSILYGSTSHELQKLQSVQNAAARLVTLSKRCEHITPILYDLHWLPIKERIKFKILLLIQKILFDSAPQYLCDLIELYVPVRSDLRSSNVNLLKRNDSKTINMTYGWRAFSICGPFLWNELPPHLRQATSVEMFKKQLKTHLFKTYFLS